ncbi:MULTISPECIES: hypothetical protein [unclassified Luteimonas]
MLKIFSLILLLMLTACDFGRSASRIAYWQSETEKYLPVGISKGDAEKFFHDRGLTLRCCMSGPNIESAHAARERNIGRHFFMEYEANIIVDFKDDKVDRVRVMRFGVGL